MQEVLQRMETALTKKNDKQLVDRPGWRGWGFEWDPQVTMCFNLSHGLLTWTTILGNLRIATPPTKIEKWEAPITLETLHFWAYKIHSSTGVRSIHMTLKTLPIPVGIFQILYLMIVFLYMFFPFPYSTWVLSRSKSVPKDEQSDHEIVTDLSRVLNCAYHPLVQHINGTSWYRSTV